MVNFIKKAWLTYGIVRDNLPALKKEAPELKGVTKEVIDKIVVIWN